MTAEQRLLRYVKQGLPDECWLWTGDKGSNGYGQLTYQGKHYNAHRLAYEVWCGPIVERDVCHTCDTRLCCNPAHLVNESRSWNMKDAVQKGRISQLMLDKIEQGRERKAAKAASLAAREESMRVNGYASLDSKGRMRDMMGRMIRKGQRLPSVSRDAQGHLHRSPDAPALPRERDERGFFV